jgi:hypothetical protein
MWNKIFYDVCEPRMFETFLLSYITMTKTVQLHLLFIFMILEGR